MTVKLVSFRHGDRVGFGAQTPSGIAELGSSDCPDLRTALGRDLDLVRRAAEVSTFIPERDVTWLPPITTGGRILCVGYNYRAHLIETNIDIPKYPSMFVRFPSAQVGHGNPIVRPLLSEQFDFEGELAVVIGRGGRHIDPANALGHVAGYACFAENSVRDYQRHATQVTPGKNFDQSGAFGPCLTTADEVPDVAALTLVTRLNGREVQRSSLDDLIFSVPQLVAYASAFTHLQPGDVIATGTPGGVGMARTPPLWMKAGDVLEVEIAGVGLLRNPVIDELPEQPTR